jgi:purine-nucleoside phosphorylase
MSPTDLPNTPANPAFPFAATIDTIASLLTAAGKTHLLKPRVGIVCGSGLSTLASHIRDAFEVPYSSLRGFGTSTGMVNAWACSCILSEKMYVVPGHKSILVFGLLGPGEGTPVVVMLGRVRMINALSACWIANQTFDQLVPSI